MQNVKEIRLETNMTQKAFAEYFNIPVRTLQDWEAEKRTPPPYVVELIKYKIKKERLGMLRLIEKNHGKEKVLFEGGLTEVVEYLQNNKDLMNWVNDEDPDMELPELDEVETLRDLEYELDKINLSWWSLEIEESKMSFEKFSEFLMGGPSRHSDRGVSYVLIKENDKEVFYAEWEVPEGEDEEKYDDEQLQEAYHAYLDGEKEYRG